MFSERLCYDFSTVARNAVKYNVWVLASGLPFNNNAINIFTSCLADVIHLLHVLYVFHVLYGLELSNGHFLGALGWNVFFSARTIGINGFSMVLLPFDHHH